MGISAKDVKELRERTNAPMMECKAALEESGGNLDAAVKVLRERGIAKMAKRADRETLEGSLQMHVGAGNRVGTAVLVTCETDFTAKNEIFQDMAKKAGEGAASVAGDSISSEQILAAEVGGTKVQQIVDDVANAIRENMGIASAVRYPGVCGSYTHFDGKSGALLEVEVGDDSKAGADEMGALLRDVCMHIVAVQPSPLAVDSSGIDPKVVEEEKEFLIKQAMDSGKPKDIAEKMVAGRMKKFYSERALLDQPFIKSPDKTVAQMIEEGAKALGTTVKVLRFNRMQIGD